MNKLIWLLSLQDFGTPPCLLPPATTPVVQQLSQASLLVSSVLLLLCCSVYTHVEVARQYKKTLCRLPVDAVGAGFDGSGNRVSVFCWGSSLCRGEYLNLS